MAFWDDDFMRIMDGALLAEDAVLDPEGLALPFSVFVNSPLLERVFDKGSATAQSRAAIRETSVTYREGDLPAPLKRDDAVALGGARLRVYKVLSDGKGAGTAFLREKRE